VARLPARHKVYLHVNNTNPMLREGSPERQAVEAAGMAVGFDGMEFSL
jgi:pyrroloquinoline quinone biosynthesis protein B